MTTRPVEAVPGHGATGAPVPGEEALRVRPAPVTAHGTADLPVPVYAVEATPGDAVAWAALSAVAAVSAAAQGAGEQPPAPAGGAAAPLAAADGRRAPWEDDGWTDGWLAGTAGREPALQDALRRLTGGLPAEAAPGATRDVELAALLRAFGFTVLVTEEDR
ncbi:hypothetical protein IHE55_26765 [Streptomyces pactum]|uniref:Uncharacterized protein n=1 Tax=Streptomyces pactum TaxID=68249 RepID=A0ABS0NT04_9ACTN|nr:hypothetical protein [Streptomyces pactum]MBH5338192.1 hypothetical protein [Streptomyces pactum]